MFGRKGLGFTLVLAVATTAFFVGAPVARAVDCSPSTFQGCSVDGFKEQAKKLRADTDLKPFAARDHVVARFSSAKGARDAARKHGARVLGRVDKGATLVLDVPDGDSVAGLSKKLKKEPGSVYAVPDLHVKSFGAPQVTQWGVEDLKAPAAHLAGRTGAGVRVAVVDTGVDYNHEDLKNNIWSNGPEASGTPGVDDDGNGFVDDIKGYDFIGNMFTAPTPDNDPMDAVGHGTHVAGIVAAEDNGVGVLGVAPDATIMPVRVLDDTGEGWDSTVAAGIRYAADNGADIINMSLGAYGQLPAVADAVRYARAAAVTIVAAAGNAFFYSLGSTPASLPGVISVAAARESDHAKTFWSDWGHVDFLAPGDAILSTTPVDSYSTFSGTSMASPHVAGALALLKEAHPAFDAKQLEETVGATAIDPYFAGKDEVSGAGFPDLSLAVGALPAVQSTLFRDPWLIPADGVTGSTITAKLLDALGDPVSGVDVDFVTDKGTLSDPSDTTDSDGEATTELTADDIKGSATVTATAAGYPTSTVRVIIEEDRVLTDDIYVMKLLQDPTGGEPGEESIIAEPPEATSSPFDLEPGDEVFVNGWIGRHNFSFDLAKASFEFTVRDPQGVVVPELSASLEPTDVFGFGSQQDVPSMPMTIPFDAEVGTYTIEGTTTTVKGGQTHTLTKEFTIGSAPTELLIVRSGFGFDAETFNYFNPHIHDSVVRRAIEDLGRSYTFWDTNVGGTPPLDELLQHSTVVWLGGWDEVPVETLVSYVEAGGNLLLSAETSAGQARIAGSAPYRDFMHSIGLLTTLFPDDNQQIYPTSVQGAGGQAFDGLTLDINSIDLNHAGESTALFNDELILNPADGAQVLFAYPDGFYSPAVAGVSVDTGAYRVVNLGFPIEAIDDGTGAATLEDTLDTILTGFAPSPSIDVVTPFDVTNSGADSITIIGDGFQPTGVTHVKIGAHPVESIVVARDVAIALIPRGLLAGIYDVTLTNPDGSSDTVDDAVKVRNARPRITSVSPRFASNDRSRAIRITGSFFRPGAKVRLAGRLIPSKFVSGARIDARIPDGFTPLGRQDVRVTNTDGQSSLARDAVLIRYGFTFNMRMGAHNRAVLELERRLKAYGFFRVGQLPNTTFGGITRLALIKYQKSRHLKPTGSLNTPTRARLNDTK